jgi:hypothetical protein
MSGLAHQLAAKLVSPPDVTDVPAPLPHRTREERLIVSAYLSMGALVTTFLATTLTLSLVA